MAVLEQNGTAAAGQHLRKHVVVIGAGAAGLVAAREAIREGHRATILESGSGVGGVWIYTNGVESDPTGALPDHVLICREWKASCRAFLLTRVHSSPTALPESAHSDCQAPDLAATAPLSQYPLTAHPKQSVCTPAPGN